VPHRLVEWLKTEDLIPADARLRLGFNTGEPYSTAYHPDQHVVDVESLEYAGKYGVLYGR